MTGAEMCVWEVLTRRWDGKVWEEDFTFLKVFAATAISRNGFCNIVKYMLITYMNRAFFSAKFSL